MILVLLLSPTDHFLFHPYHVSVVVISYEWLIISSVWITINVNLPSHLHDIRSTVISYRRVINSSVWHKHCCYHLPRYVITEVLTLMFMKQKYDSNSSVWYNNSTPISYGWLSNLFVWYRHTTVISYGWLIKPSVWYRYTVVMRRI